MPHVSRRDWRLVRRFGPYLGRYRLASSASVILMVLYTALNIANPFLIGVAIDNLITRGNLSGLVYAIGGLVVLNIAMWQAQYWQVWSMSWVGEQVLLVRHSYKPGLRLPSGGVRSGEDHCLAAVRELHEEVGLTVAPDDLHLVSTFKGPYGMNYLYEAELATKPNLVADRREIIAASFAAADMARERHQFVRRYLKTRVRLMPG